MTSSICWGGGAKSRHDASSHPQRAPKTNGTPQDRTTISKSHRTLLAMASQPDVGWTNTVCTPSSHLQNLIREPESHIATPPKMESKATEMHHSPTSPPDRLNHSKSASASAVMRLKAKDDAAVRYDPLPARPPAPTSFSEPGPMCSSAMGLWGGAAAAGGAAGGGAGGLGGLRPRAELRYCRSCWRCAARMW